MPCRFIRSVHPFDSGFITIHNPISSVPQIIITMMIELATIVPMILSGVAAMFVTLIAWLGKNVFQKVEALEVEIGTCVRRTEFVEMVAKIDEQNRNSRAELVEMLAKFDGQNRSSHTETNNRLDRIYTALIRLGIERRRSDEDG